MRKLIVFSLIVVMIWVFLPPKTHAQDQILYTSQPDAIAIFLNNMAFVQDTILLPGGVDVQIILPPTIYPDTLLLWENDQRVPNYRLRSQAGQAILYWQSDADQEVNNVRLEYLISGIRWQPKYDMWLQDENATTVDLDFFAEITNSSLSLEDVDVRLVAGNVDISQQIDTVTTITMNQYFAGYEETNIPVVSPELGTGSTNIQYVYTTGNISAEVGDVIYTNITQETLEARRVLFWNSNTSNQIDVIYKVRNTAALPFAQGVVRSYQNNLFLGSDFIELTPINSEGSVTVGNFQNARVQRDETENYIGGNDVYQDTRHSITLTLTNFDEETITIEVAEIYPQGAHQFEFSVEPEQEAGNLFRWTVTLEPNASTTITYEFVD